MITIALIHLLKTNNAVKALIDDRIHVDDDPQATPRPKITIASISEVRGLSNDGPSDMPNAHFRIDCWADTPLQAWLISDKARLAIDGFSGNVTAKSAEGTGNTTYAIKGIHVRDQYQNKPQTPDGQNNPPARYSLDVRIHHKH